MSIGIGETLREARREAGVRLADVAAETRIRQSHLVALEEENFAAIGGDVYVKGFIRSYARHLDIDPEPLVGSYQEEYQVPEANGNWVANEPVESLPPPRRPITTIVVVLAVLTLGGLALLGFLAPDDEDDSADPSAPDPVAEDTPPDDAGAEADPEPAGGEDDGEDEGEDGEGEGEDGEDDGDGESDDEGADDVDDPDAEDDAVPDPSEEIVLTVSVPEGRSWARVTVDGEQVEETTLESGYSETYAGDDIRLRLGNAAAVSLEVNGEAFEVGGTVAEIACSTAAGECEIG